MATSSTVRPSSTALQNLAGTVHTYESFGRAVISQVLAESSDATHKDGVPAQFTVKAMTSPTHGSGEPYCVTVTVMIGTTAHWIMVCTPIVIA
jgi:hypothetical protein